MTRRMIFVLLLGKLIQVYSLGLLQTETLLAVLWLAMTAIVAEFITWPAHPNYRKQGIGRCMTEAAEQWLKERGVGKVMLLVRETNTQVIDFYEHLGFETIPRVIMQKWLT